MDKWTRVVVLFAFAQLVCAALGMFSIGSIIGGVIGVVFGELTFNYEDWA